MAVRQSSQTSNCQRSVRTGGPAEQTVCELGRSVAHLAKYYKNDVFLRVFKRSWAFLGRSWSGLGAVLGRSWRGLGALWGFLGTSWEHLEAVLARLGAVLKAPRGCLSAVLWPSGDTSKNTCFYMFWRLRNALGTLLERSVHGLGASCRGLGAILRRYWAVLERFWGSLGPVLARSWGILGRSVAPRGELL